MQRVLELGGCGNALGKWGHAVCCTTAGSVNDEVVKLSRIMKDVVVTAVVCLFCARTFTVRKGTESKRYGTQAERGEGVHAGQDEGLGGTRQARPCMRERHLSGHDNSRGRIERRRRR